jgi:OPT oligopeptide transporter protein
MSQTLAERSAAQTDLSTDDRDRPLPVTGFKGTHEEIERKWYEEVYRGRGDSMAQLTWRAVLVGSCLGGVLSLTNLYIGLKAGWGFGVATTASILSYAIWTSLLKVGLARTPMTILENNCMQSAASSAGYSTGGTPTASGLCPS